MSAGGQQLVIDAKGKAHLPKGYKLSPEEHNVVNRNVVLGTFKAAAYSCCMAGPVYPLLATYKPHVPRRIHAEIGGILCVLAFSGMAVLHWRRGYKEMQGLPDSLVASLISHNKEWRAKE